MHKRLFIYLTLFLSLIIKLSAQNCFQVVYGGLGTDLNKKCIELNNGAFLTIGSTSSLPLNNQAVCVSKEGNIVWNLNYGYQQIGADDILSDVIQTKDSNIYTCGTAYVWNFDGNPAITKIGLDGKILFDSAYPIPNLTKSSAVLDFIYEDTFRKVLVGFGLGNYSSNLFPYYQITDYSGNRIHYRMMNDLVGLLPFGFLKSSKRNEYILLCDSGDRHNSLRLIQFLVRIDTLGNVIEKRQIMIGNTPSIPILQLNDSGFFLVNWNSQPPIPKFSIFQFTIAGDLIRTKTISENGDYGATLYSSDSKHIYMYSKYIYTLDSSLNIKDSATVFSINDSCDYVYSSMAKDGSFFGVSNYYGGNRNFPDNAYDYHFYKTTPDWKMNSQLQYHYNGIAQLEGALDLKIFPNPVVDKVYLSNLETIQVLIQSVDGKIVLNGILKTGEGLDISKLTNGIYFVQVENQKVQKLIVAK